MTIYETAYFRARDCKASTVIIIITTIAPMCRNLARTISRRYGPSPSATLRIAVAVHHSNSMSNQSLLPG